MKRVQAHYNDGRPRTVALNGWKRQPYDPRDFKYQLKLQGPLTAPPPSVDLRSISSPIEDQADIGSCFPAGTPILMADGTERPIEEVGVGNLVLTHDGRKRSVTRVYERQHDELMYSVKLQGWYSPIVMTGEHPVAVVHNVHPRAKWGGFEPGPLTWTKASELKPGDFALHPVPTQNEDRPNPKLRLRDFVSFDGCIESEGKLRIVNAARAHMINAEVELDEVLCRLFGLFLAEGSYDKVGGRPVEITFTFARHEVEYQNFVQEALKNVFGVASRLKVSDARPSITDVVCSNATLARVFFNICGEGALHKAVSVVFFAAPERCRLALLRGWLEGDGTQGPLRISSKDGVVRKAVQVEGSTSSEELQRGMFRLALTCGLKPGTSEKHQNAKPRSVHFYSSDVLKVFPESAAVLEDAGITPTGRTQWRRHDLGALVRIKAIEVQELDAPIQVYNLEVDERHTYVANMLAVHNCTAQAAAALVEANQIREGRKAGVVIGPDEDTEEVSDGTGPLQAPAKVTVSNIKTSAAGVLTFTTTVVPATAPPTPTPPAPTPPTPPSPPTPAPPEFVNVSRLFTYYATRKLDGTTATDEGAYIRDAIKSMAKYGMVDELLWPYDTKKFAVDPPKSLWDTAEKHKITSYHSIANGDVETMKATLAKGYLIEFGFDVYSYFLSSDMAKKGMLCRPKLSEALEGGHAVALCGYDDNKLMPDGTVGAFLVRNSWGTGWGNPSGCYWMAYNYVGDYRMSSDFWVILSSPL